MAQNVYELQMLLDAKQFIKNTQALGQAWSAFAGRLRQNEGELWNTTVLGYELVGAGRQMTETFQDMAREADRFRVQLQAMRQSAEVSAVINKGFLETGKTISDAGQALSTFTAQYKVGVFSTINEVSRKLSTNIEATSQAMQLLLRAGFDPQQAEKITMRFADAAVNIGADIEQAIVKGAEGLLQERSILLNSAGVAENVSTYYNLMAKSLNKQVQSLTTSEKLQARYNLVMDSTADKVGLAQIALSGYLGALRRLNYEYKNFIRNFGVGIEAVFQPIVEAAAFILKIFNFLPPVFTKVAGAIAAFSGILLLVSGSTLLFISALTRLVGTINGSLYGTITGIRAFAEAFRGASLAMDEFGMGTDRTAKSIRDFKKTQNAKEIIEKLTIMGPVPLPVQSSSFAAPSAAPVLPFVDPRTTVGGVRIQSFIQQLKELDKAASTAPEAADKIAKINAQAMNLVATAKSLGMSSTKQGFDALEESIFFLGGVQGQNQGQARKALGDFAAFSKNYVKAERSFFDKLIHSRKRFADMEGDGAFAQIGRTAALLGELQKKVDNRDVLATRVIGFGSLKFDRATRGQITSFLDGSPMQATGREPALLLLSNLMTAVSTQSLKAGSDYKEAMKIIASSTRDLDGKLQSSGLPTFVTGLSQVGLHNFKSQFAAAQRGFSTGLIDFERNFSRLVGKDLKDFPINFGGKLSEQFSKSFGPNDPTGIAAILATGNMGEFVKKLSTIPNGNGITSAQSTAIKSFFEQILASAKTSGDPLNSWIVASTKVVGSRTKSQEAFDKAIASLTREVEAMKHSVGSFGVLAAGQSIFGTKGFDPSRTDVDTIRIIQVLSGEQGGLGSINKTARQLGTFGTDFPLLMARALDPEKIRQALDGMNNDVSSLYSGALVSGTAQAKGSIKAAKEILPREFERIMKAQFRDQGLALKLFDRSDPAQANLRREFIMAARANTPMTEEKLGRYLQYASVTSIPVIGGIPDTQRYRLNLGDIEENRVRQLAAVQRNLAAENEKSLKRQAAAAQHLGTVAGSLWASMIAGIVKVDKFFGTKFGETLKKTLDKALLSMPVGPTNWGWFTRGPRPARGSIEAKPAQSGALNALGSSLLFFGQSLFSRGRGEPIDWHAKLLVFGKINAFLVNIVKNMSGFIRVLGLVAAAMNPLTKMLIVFLASNLSGFLNAIGGAFSLLYSSINLLLVGVDRLVVKMSDNVFGNVIGGLARILGSLLSLPGDVLEGFGNAWKKTALELDFISISTEMQTALEERKKAQEAQNALVKAGKGSSQEPITLFKLPSGREIDANMSVIDYWDNKIAELQAKREKVAQDLGQSRGFDIDISEIGNPSYWLENMKAKFFLGAETYGRALAEAATLKKQSDEMLLEFAAVDADIKRGLATTGRGSVTSIEAVEAYKNQIAEIDKQIKSSMHLGVRYDQLGARRKEAIKAIESLEPSVKALKEFERETQDTLESIAISQLPGGIRAFKEIDAEFEKEKRELEEAEIANAADRDAMMVGLEKIRGEKIRAETEKQYKEFRELIVKNEYEIAKTREEERARYQKQELDNQATIYSTQEELDKMSFARKKSELVQLGKIGKASEESIAILQAKSEQEIARTKFENLYKLSNMRAMEEARSAANAVTLEKRGLQIQMQDEEKALEEKFDSRGSNFGQLLQQLRSKYAELFAQADQRYAQTVKTIRAGMENEQTSLQSEMEAANIAFVEAVLDARVAAFNSYADSLIESAEKINDYPVGLGFSDNEDAEKLLRLSNSVIFLSKKIEDLKKSGDAANPAIETLRSKVKDLTNELREAAKASGDELRGSLKGLRESLDKVRDSLAKDGGTFGLRNSLSTLPNQFDPAIKKIRSFLTVIDQMQSGLGDPGVDKEIRQVALDSISDLVEQYQDLNVAVDEVEDRFSELKQIGVGIFGKNFDVSDQTALQKEANAFSERSKKVREYDQLIGNLQTNLVNYRQRALSDTKNLTKDSLIEGEKGISDQIKNAQDKRAVALSDLYKSEIAMQLLNASQTIGIEKNKAKAMTDLLLQEMDRRLKLADIEAKKELSLRISNIEILKARLSAAKAALVDSSSVAQASRDSQIAAAEEAAALKKVEILRANLMEVTKQGGKVTEAQEQLLEAEIEYEEKRKIALEATIKAKYAVIEIMQKEIDVMQNRNKALFEGLSAESKMGLSQLLQGNIEALQDQAIVYEKTLNKIADERVKLRGDNVDYELQAVEALEKYLSLTKAVVDGQMQILALENAREESILEVDRARVSTLKSQMSLEKAIFDSQQEKLLRDGKKTAEEVEKAKAQYAYDYAIKSAEIEEKLLNREKESKLRLIQSETQAKISAINLEIEMRKKALQVQLDIAKATKTINSIDAENIQKLISSLDKVKEDSVKSIQENSKTQVELVNEENKAAVNAIKQSRVEAEAERDKALSGLKEDNKEEVELYFTKFIQLKEVLEEIKKLESEAANSLGKSRLQQAADAAKLAKQEEELAKKRLEAARQRASYAPYDLDAQAGVLDATKEYLQAQNSTLQAMAEERQVRRENAREVALFGALSVATDVERADSALFAAQARVAAAQQELAVRERYTKSLQDESKTLDANEDYRGKIKDAILAENDARKTLLETQISLENAHKSLIKSNELDASLEGASSSASIEAAEAKVRAAKLRLEAQRDYIQSLKEAGKDEANAATLVDVLRQAVEDETNARTALRDALYEQSAAQLAAAETAQKVLEFNLKKNGIESQLAKTASTAQLLSEKMLILRKAMDEAVANEDALRVEDLQKQYFELTQQSQDLADSLGSVYIESIKSRNALESAFLQLSEGGSENESKTLLNTLRSNLEVLRAYPAAIGAMRSAGASSEAILKTTKDYVDQTIEVRKSGISIIQLIGEQTGKFLDTSLAVKSYSTALESARKAGLDFTQTQKALETALLNSFDAQRELIGVQERQVSISSYVTSDILAYNTLTNAEKERKIALKDGAEAAKEAINIARQRVLISQKEIDVLRTLDVSSETLLSAYQKQKTELNGLIGAQKSYVDLLKQQADSSKSASDSLKGQYVSALERIKDTSPQAKRELEQIAKAQYDASKAILQNTQGRSSEQLNEAAIEYSNAAEKLSQMRGTSIDNFLDPALIKGAYETAERNTKSAYDKLAQEQGTLNQMIQQYNVSMEQQAGLMRQISLDAVNATNALVTGMKALVSEVTTAVAETQKLKSENSLVGVEKIIPQTVFPQAEEFKNIFNDFLNNFREMLKNNAAAAIGTASIPTPVLSQSVQAQTEATKPPLINLESYAGSIQNAVMSAIKQVSQTPIVNFNASLTSNPDLQQVGNTLMDQVKRVVGEEIAKQTALGKFRG